MTTKILLLTISLFTIIGNASAQYCTSNKRYTDVQFFDSSQISIGANIQYGIAQDFQGNPDTLRLDLYYPNLTIDTSSKCPFILLFHGGGFSSGDKQSGDIRDLCIHLAMRG
ncbi:MAG: carboxylesterase family protein [Bacteroidetes bacterium]|nr:carboxylesterase family protein [Bacteroidota bacterium]